MKRNLNLENIKPTTTKQRWFLSTLLIAVLGSNYYFQASSYSMGAFELSSQNPTSTTEGRPSPAADCTGAECSVSVLPKTQKELQDVINKAVGLALTEKEKLAKEAEDKKKKEEEDKAKAETPREKRLRLAEEKKEKEQSEREARNEEFADRMEEAASSCEEDVTCKISRFTSLLEKFKGKKKVDFHVANKAFNEHISKDLKAALRNPEMASTVLESLQAINSEIPSEYRQLKEKAVDIARYDGMAKAMEINRNFKMADQLTKAKRPTEAMQYLSAATMQRDDFVMATESLYQTMSSSLKEADDFSTMEYIRKTYMPDMQKLLASMTNVNGLDLGTLNSTTQSASGTLNQPTTQNTTTTRGNVRGGNTTMNTVNNPLQKTGTLEGVNFGSQSNSPQSTRTGRSN